MLKVSASELKAKLGKFMKAVRSGKEVIVTDRDEPVARIIPYKKSQPERRKLTIVQPADPSAPPLGEIEVKSIRYNGRNTTELLREDRDRR